MNFSNHNELAKKMDGLVEYQAVHRVQRVEVNASNEAYVNQSERTMHVKRSQNSKNSKETDFVIERSEKHESKVFNLKKNQKWLKKL